MSERTSRELAASAYVILGMIALRGPSTPYELERAVRRSIGHFWPFPRSQFHAGPERLAGHGFLSEQRESTGRRRRIYSITDAGREALQEWLEAPTDQPVEIRDRGALKLFFGELMDDDALASLAREQEAANRRLLERLAEIREHYEGEEDGRQIRLAPLELGLRMMEAEVGYWRDLAESPPSLNGKRPRRKS